jgi:uncharacterized transporter YbjL
MLFLVFGIVLGITGKMPGKIAAKSAGFQFWSLLLILFAMGVGIGSNNEIIESFLSIGLHSAAFAAAAIIGSLAMVRIFRPVIQRKREETR